MLLWLADYLSQFYSPFSVVKYLTLRGIFAVITALSICWVLGPRVIRLLNDLQMGQAIRSDGPQSHLSKAGTPTMGGALIWWQYLSAPCSGQILKMSMSGWCSVSPLALA